jgi:putative copper resistance protein D
VSVQLHTAQQAATVVLNLGVALAAGAGLSTLWLATGTSAWAAHRRGAVWRWALAGVLAALLANAALLWFEAAAMAEVPLAQAGGAARTLLAATHYGMAWGIGMAALALGAMAAVASPRRPHLAALGGLVALAVVWYSRSMVSHAASEGYLSLPLLADWAHRALISLWVGEVILAALVMLGGPAPIAAGDRRDRARYVGALSRSATFALAGIFVTGLYIAWHTLGGIGNLLGNPYGNTLLAKLVLVACAALLGAVNRFIVMPPWLARECAGQAARQALPKRFRRVLQAEGVVLLAVLMLAAVLASTSPPGAGM